MRPALTYEQRRELRERISQARRDKLERERQRRRADALKTLSTVAGDYRFTPKS